MQMKLLLAEDLDDRQSDDNNIVFPNYTNPDIAKWTDDRDELAFPLYQLAESIRKLQITLTVPFALSDCFPIGYSKRAPSNTSMLVRI